MVFLKKQDQVIATLDEDYPEWHKQRQKFGLWYLEIHQPELVAYLDQLREIFAAYLYQPNQRQYHISLFICGFIETLSSYDDDFSDEVLAEHYRVLSQLKLKKFKLKTKQINSFSAALFLEIEDSEQHLAVIRSTLQQLTHCEIAALEYCPHITLGLYKDTFSAQQIFDLIAILEQQAFEIEVKNLTFGYYFAQQLQGSLSAMHQLQLSSL